MPWHLGISELQFQFSLYQQRSNYFMNMMLEIFFSLCFAQTQTGSLLTQNTWSPGTFTLPFSSFSFLLLSLKKSWHRKLNLVFGVGLLESFPLCWALDWSYIVLSYWLRGAAKLCTINVKGSNWLTTVRKREL